MRYRVKIPSASGRWMVGEVGESLPNDFPEKYAVKLDLGDSGDDVPGNALLQALVGGRRVFYFHANEVEPA